MYERAFLMQMRQSPLAKTPPANLPVIPGVTVPASTSPNKNCSTSPKKHNDSGSDVSRTSSMEVPTKLQTVTGKQHIHYIYYLVHVYKRWTFIDNYTFIKWNTYLFFQKTPDQRMINLVLICKYRCQTILSDS